MLEFIGTLIIISFFKWPIEKLLNSPLMNKDPTHTQNKLIFCDTSKMKIIFPLGIFTLLNIGVTLIGLSYIDVPLFNTLRRTQTIIIMGVESLFICYRRRQNPSSAESYPHWETILAVLVLTTGAVVAGMGDMLGESKGSSKNASETLFGIIMTVTGCVFAALQLTYINIIGKSHVDCFTMNLYQAYIILPLTLIISLIPKENPATGESATSFVNFANFK